MGSTGKDKTFEVIEVEAIGDNVWRVLGRNYEDIHLGDHLYAYPDDGTDRLTFEVVGINAFARQLPWISQGYGCKIDFKGEGGEVISSVSHLYNT